MNDMSETGLLVLINTAGLFIMFYSSKILNFQLLFVFLNISSFIGFMSINGNTFIRKIKHTF